MGRKYAEKPYKFRRNDIIGKTLNYILSDHISSVCSVCSVVIMTPFTIRLQREPLVWKREL